MDTKPAPNSKEPTEVWKALSLYMPARNADADYWWQRTAPQAALVLEKAGYTTAQQYDALLFLYHWVIPELGPGLDSPNRKWRSLLANDGSPFELSWKWNTISGPPEVRYVIEPINEFSGTTVDPLNGHPSMRLRHRLAAMLPDIDLTWSHHFAAALFGHDKARLQREMMPPGHKMPPGFTIPSTVVALEFPHKGSISTKSYFIPRKHGQGVWLPTAEWEESIAELDPVNKARTAVVDFINRDADAWAPIMLAVDDKAVDEARIKWYFATAKSSLAWARDIMTLGGKITTEHLPHLETQLKDLCELIKGITGVPADHPDDADLPPAPRFDPAAGEGNYVPLPLPVAGYQAHFNIAPGSEVPGVKLYLPMRRYMRDDLSVARGITSVMEARGRGEYCQAYMDMLEGILPADKHVDQVNTLQSYISCLFKKNGELEITSYLGLAPYDAGK